jgi:putative transposase
MHGLSLAYNELFKRHPNLKSFYGRCGSLWSVGKFISTIGNVSAETIKKYIADQKGK